MHGVADDAGVHEEQIQQLQEQLTAQLAVTEALHADVTAAQAAEQTAHVSHGTLIQHTMVSNIFLKHGVLVPRCPFVGLNCYRSRYCMYLHLWR